MGMFRQSSEAKNGTPDETVGLMVREFNGLLTLLEEVVFEDTKLDPSNDRVHREIGNWRSGTLELRRIMHRFATAENFFKEHYETLDRIRDTRTDILNTYGPGTDEGDVSALIDGIRTERMSLANDLEKIRRRRRDQEKMAKVVAPPKNDLPHTHKLSREDRKLKEYILQYMDSQEGDTVLLSDVGDMLTRSPYKITGKLKTKCESLGLQIVESGGTPPIVSIVKPEDRRGKSDRR